MFADPGQWWRNWRQSPGPDSDALLRLGLAIALALFIASFFPASYVPVILSRAFEAGALMAALFATLGDDDWQAARITAWDEAAILLLFAIAAKTFITSEALGATTLAAG